MAVGHNAAPMQSNLPQGARRGEWSASRARLLLTLAALLSGVVALTGAPGCKRASDAPQKPEEKPQLRFFTLGGAAGAIEPCGCVKDMLGGVDHAAAFIAQSRAAASGTVVLGAGPMLFADPVVSSEERTQALFKADAMASSLKDLGLVAWAPGANDWALGADELGRLSKETGAALLAANLTGKTAGAQATRIVEAGGEKIGLVGVSLPTFRGGTVEGVEMGAAEAALAAGQKSVMAAGARIAVALIAGNRGTSLRLAESVKGFQLVVVCKGFDQGDANDAPFPPTIVGDALVVQAPNHLQGVGVVDLFVRGQSYQFADGSGVALEEERTSVSRRIDELSRRIKEWEKPNSGVKPAEVEARKRDLAALEAQKKKLDEPRVPNEGSYFRYELVSVRESLGADKAVSGRLEAYYRRVNEYNQKAFADLKPEPAPAGQASFVGIEQCSSCHLEERAVWDTTAHAGAYATLESGHKQFNLDCVSCHVTGYDKPGGSTVTHVDNLKNVQCEVCHGPGSRHIENPGDKTLIRRRPETSVCTTCHHPPHVHSDWSVEQAWPKILGKGHGG